MRKLPLLFALLLLALLVAAASSQAALLPQPAEATALLAPDEEEAEAEGSEAEAAEDEEEACEPDEEELCEEEAEEPAPGGKGEDSGQGKGKDDACALKSARAAVNVNPGKRLLRLSVHYRTWRPVSVSVQAALLGVSGAVRLGSEHARFRRSGVYRETYVLAEKQTKRASAAREVSVDLEVAGSSPPCRLHLSEAVRPAKR